MRGFEGQLSSRRLLRRHIGLAAVVWVTDQVSKLLILSFLEPFSSVYVTGFFNLVLVFNEGAAFGMLANSSWDVNQFFLVTNVVIIVLLIYVLWTLRPGRNQPTTAIWLIIGGALGNITDRILYGHVVDFLDFHYAGWHYATFNIADSFISIGAVLIVLDLFKIRILFRRG